MIMNANSFFYLHYYYYTQIDYLHKKYGDNVPQSKKTNIAGKIEVKLENAFIFLLLLP